MCVVFRRSFIDVIRDMSSWPSGWHSCHVFMASLCQNLNAQAIQMHTRETHLPYHVICDQTQLRLTDNWSSLQLIKQHASLMNRTISELVILTFAFVARILSIDVFLLLERRCALFDVDGVSYVLDGHWFVVISTQRVTKKSRRPFWLILSKQGVPSFHRAHPSQVRRRGFPNLFRVPIERNNSAKTELDACNRTELAPRSKACTLLYVGITWSGPRGGNEGGVSFSWHRLKER